MGEGGTASPAVAGRTDANPRVAGESGHKRTQRTRRDMLQVKVRCRPAGAGSGSEKRSSITMPLLTELGARSSPGARHRALFITMPPGACGQISCPAGTIIHTCAGCCTGVKTPAYPHASLTGRRAFGSSLVTRPRPHRPGIACCQGFDPTPSPRVSTAHVLPWPRPPGPTPLAPRPF